MTSAFYKSWWLLLLASISLFLTLSITEPAQIELRSTQYLWILGHLALFFIISCCIYHFRNNHLKSLSNSEDSILYVFKEVYRHNRSGVGDLNIEYSELLKEFKIHKNISASERALIDEKKNMIKDLFTTLRKNEFELLSKMHLRMGSIRSELAGITKKKEASKAYMNAPRPKLMAA